jgi:hypothetical protein
VTVAALPFTDTAPAPSAAGRPQVDLGVWAAEAQQIHQISISLSRTSFVPSSMKGRPEEVTGAILAGREIGLPPMVALRIIDIIDGTPAIRAHGLRGIVQSHGHAVWVEDSTETRAVVCGHRADEPGRVQRSVWTTERARKANLLGKKNWVGHTQAMLIARATAELCRLIASDAIIGMPYCREELEDAADSPAAVVEAPPPGGKRRMRRGAQTPEQVQNAAGAAPLEPVSVETQAPAVSEDATSFARFHAVFREAGDRFPDRESRISFCNFVVQRPITSSTELTPQEMEEVIAAVQATEPGEP